MTREEIMNLGLEELETRAAAIATETAEADKEQLEALNAELDAIEERKAAIIAENEEKRKAAEAVAAGAGKEIEKREGEQKMTSREIRSSKEYVDAYVAYIKGESDGAECRALLSENASENGTIAVPTFVEDAINTAWENDEIMSRVRRTFFRGNLKVGVEVSSTGAVVHTEGAEAIQEETLVIDYVDLIPQMIKKLVRVSDEAMDLRGEAFLNYLYDEINYQIVKLAAGTAVAAIETAAGEETPIVATQSMAGADLTTADVINAQGLLSGQATNVALITTRANAAKLKAAALSAGYGYDPFDGLPVLYVDASAFTDAEAIVADLSGVQANFPDGDDVKFKFDELTEAAADIVRIIGRLYVAIGVVAAGKAVVIAPAESE